MKGIHVYWSKPSLDGNITFRNYDIIPMMLSALLWKKHNDSIDLYTDTPTKEFYTDLGILDIYDNINVKIIDNIPNEINPNIYWDIPKIYVYNKMEIPFCNINTSLFYRKKFNPNIFTDVQYYYREYNAHVISPNPEMFLNDSHFKYDWNCEYSINDSFLYVKNLDIVRKHFKIAEPFLLNEENNKSTQFDIYGVKLHFIKNRLFGEILNEGDYIDVKYINEVFLPLYDTWRLPDDDKSNISYINTFIENNKERRDLYPYYKDILEADMKKFIDEIGRLSLKYGVLAENILKNVDDWDIDRFPYLKEDFNIEHYM